MDTRQFELLVAGPAALIVAKVHKIMDRVDEADRRRDKDAEHDNIGDFMINALKQNLDDSI